MTQRLITHLRHVDLAVPDYPDQLDFYTNAWGLKAEHSDTGLTFLAAEGSPEQYVVRLRQSADKRIDLISFGAATPADVDTLAAQVAADGVQLISEPGTAEDPRRRLRLPVLRQRGPHRRDQLRRRRPAAPQDRGGRVDPGPSLARRHQLRGPRGHLRVRREAPGVRPVGHPDAPAHGGDDVVHADQRMAPQHGDRPRAATVSAPRVLRDARHRRVHARHRPAAARRRERRSVDRVGTWPATTPSATSSTHRATRWSTRPSWRGSTRTPGTRTCTTSREPDGQ